MRILFILFFNLFFITTILAKQYTSHISVNLIKPITILVNNIDLGIYVIGSPKPKEKHTKIIIEDSELNKQINLSVNPRLVLSANGGINTVNLNVLLSNKIMTKIDSRDIEADMTISFQTLPTVPGNYTGTITINADYN